MAMSEVVGIEALVEAGILEWERREAEKREAARKAERARVAQAELEKRRLIAAAKQVLSEVLHPYLELRGNLPTEHDRHYWVDIGVPGCTEMWVCFDRAPYGAPERAWTWDGIYHAKGKPYARHPSDMWEETEVRFSDSQRFDREDLPLALGWSALVCEQVRAMVEQIEEERQEKIKLAAERERAREARERREAEREQARLEEQAELVRELEGDAVAMALLRVYVAVREDRWSLQEQTLEGWQE